MSIIYFYLSQNCKSLLIGHKSNFVAVFDKNHLNCKNWQMWSVVFISYPPLPPVIRTKHILAFKFSRCYFCSEIYLYLHFHCPLYHYPNLLLIEFLLESIILECKWKVERKYNTKTTSKLFVELSTEPLIPFEYLRSQKKRYSLEALVKWIFIL